MKVSAAHSERGIALVSSLLLLVVLTLLALAMFRGFSIQGRIAGNVREKQRALTAAQSAQQYAEWWLSQGGNAAIAPVECDTALDANLNQGQICTNRLDSVTSVPWATADGSMGVHYTPSLMQDHVSETSGAGTFYARPTFYIADMGASADGQGEIFQVDAAGWGASPNSVAVVESTFQVTSGVLCRSCP